MICTKIGNEIFKLNSTIERWNRALNHNLTEDYRLEVQRNIQNAIKEIQKLKKLEERT